MDKVVEFPALQTEEPEAAPQPHYYLFIAVTEDQCDRFSHTKLWPVELCGFEGATRIPINVDMAALTIATPHIARALRRAGVKPCDVRESHDGAPLGEYASYEAVPASDEFPRVMNGYHLLLVFESADDKVRFARQYGAVEAPKS